MAETGGGWLKHGCLGCLSLAGTVALAAAVLVGWTWLQVRSPRVAERTLSPEVPAAARVTPGESGAPRDAGGRPAAGRVILDLYHADLEIDAAPVGGRLQVETAHDERSYQLTEALDAPRGEDWTYELKLKPRRPVPMILLGHLLGASRPRVSVLLPEDVPVRLELRSLRTKVRTDLGGLWLATAELDCQKGPVDVAVGRPLRAPMESLSFDGRLGDFRLSELGNASPREVRIATLLGDLKVDLNGAWLADAEIRIRSRVGSAVLELPDDVTIEGLDVERLRPVPGGELTRPTLRFSVGADELRVID